MSKCENKDMIDVLKHLQWARVRPAVGNFPVKDRPGKMCRRYPNLVIKLIDKSKRTFLEDGYMMIREDTTMEHVVCKDMGITNDMKTPVTMHTVYLTDTVCTKSTFVYLNLVNPKKTTVTLVGCNLNRCKTGPGILLVDCVIIGGSVSSDVSTKGCVTLGDVTRT